MEKCKIVIDRNELRRKLKKLKWKRGMRGLVLRIKKPSGDSTNRRQVSRSNLELLRVWQRRRKNKIKGEVINVPLKIITTGGIEVGDSAGEWEFAQEIDNSKFDFAFFHYDTLRILLDYDRGKYKGLVVSGVKMETDEKADGGSENCYFSFRLSGSSKADAIAEDLGFPKVDFGLACPPKWDEGDKNKNPKDKILGVFHEKIMSI